MSSSSGKLGGIGGPYPRLRGWKPNPPLSSVALAAEWKPYIETCIEASRVNRCMFESDLPVAAELCSYRVLWNVFKRLTVGTSRDAKTALFSDTATRIYRLEL